MHLTIIITTNAVVSCHGRPLKKQVTIFLKVQKVTSARVVISGFQSIHFFLPQFVSLQVLV